MEQQCLRIVVLVMGHAYPIRTECLPSLLKIGVSQFAGRHLDAHALPPGVGAGVKGSHVQPQVQLGAQSSAKSLVPLRLLPAQVEVAVDRPHVHPQRYEASEQGHRVCAAAQPIDNHVASACEVMLLQGACHLACQVFHVTNVQKAKEMGKKWAQKFCK